MHANRHHFLDYVPVASQFSSCTCHTGSDLCPHCGHHLEHAQQLYAEGKITLSKFDLIHLVSPERAYAVDFTQTDLCFKPEIIPAQINE